MGGKLHLLYTFTQPHGKHTRLCVEMEQEKQLPNVQTVYSTLMKQQQKRTPTRLGVKEDFFREAQSSELAATFMRVFILGCIFPPSNAVEG